MSFSDRDEVVAVTYPLWTRNHAETVTGRQSPNVDARTVTWSELWLPVGRAHLGDYVRLRFGLFLLAWALVSLHWLAWQALPFQIAIAVAVLWHAVRRERLLESTEAVEAQLRIAKERYGALVETLPLATYVDRPGQVIGAGWVSAQIEEITSYGADEWIADSTLLAKVLHPEDRERVLAEMERVKASGAALDHEYRIVRRDGSSVWIHDSAVIVLNDGPAYARGFIVDVTARRHAELELERQNDQLRQLDSLKDEFIALVSHELRTPLTSIRGYLELMSEDTNLTEEQVTFFETIDRNAQRLQRVVGDLLFCAQAEAGKLTLEHGNVDLDTVVAEAIEAAQPAAQGKQVELVTDLGGLPEIPGDRARLAQVIDNLLSNAIKFTPSEGRVTVSTRPGCDEVELFVSDTGMGIPASELEHLFQRFFRTDLAMTSAIPGTGLGLVIARAIVEGHGGRIEVASEVGAGTTFCVSLPGT